MGGHVVITSSRRFLPGQLCLTSGGARGHTGAARAAGVPGAAGTGWVLGVVGTWGGKQGPGGGSDAAPAPSACCGVEVGVGAPSPLLRLGSWAGWVKPS